MRDIKFRYQIHRHVGGGRFEQVASNNHIEEYSLEQVEAGEVAGKYEPDADKFIIHRVQGSGLKDKNGVEIYEGDLVRQFGCVVEVKFKLGCFGYYADMKGQFIAYGTHHHIDWDSPQVEVVGNIFQNKGLLNDSYRTRNSEV